MVCQLLAYHAWTIARNEHHNNASRLAYFLPLFVHPPARLAPRAALYCCLYARRRVFQSGDSSKSTSIPVASLILRPLAK
jgi:hypothetical protein